MTGTAIIVQGDSRRLGEVLERAQICLSSPPYSNSEIASQLATQAGGAGIAERRQKRAAGDWEGYGQTDGNLGNLPDTGFEAALAISSPAWMGNDMRKGGSDLLRNHAIQTGRNPDNPGTASLLSQSPYGNEPGQLAQMPEGDLALVLGSPPYIGSLGDGKSGIDWSKQADRETTHPHGWAGENYGQSNGQLAALPEGDHAAAAAQGSQQAPGAEARRPVVCISSPPWESSLESKDTEFQASARPGRTIQCANYGSEEGQLGRETGSTFWGAAREILEQVYKVLAPGAHAIFVCKRFVRDGKIVEFSTQWAQLCEAVGFNWIHHHKAWLVEDRGTQYTLEGKLEKRQVERKSFFRRLAESKGSPRIDYEDVLCFQKPL